MYNIKVEPFVINDPDSMYNGNEANNYICDFDYVNFRIAMKNQNVGILPFDKWNGIEIYFMNLLTAVHIIPEKVFTSEVDNHLWMTFSYMHYDSENDKYDYETTDTRFRLNTYTGRHFQILSLIIYLATWEYDIDIENKVYTRATALDESYKSYSDKDKEQIWALTRQLMLNMLTYSPMMDTYEQLSEKMPDDIEEIDFSKDKAESDKDEISEDNNTDEEDVKMDAVNFESTLEFIEFLRNCKESDVAVDFYRDTYNGVPIKALMEFTLVGCIPKFVRNIPDIPDKKMFIVDVPTDEEGKTYERKQYIVTISPNGNIEYDFTKLITDDIIPNMLKVNLENLDSDIFNMALDCTHRTNQIYHDARLITYLTRKIKLLEVQLNCIYNDTEYQDYDPDTNNFTGFSWEDIDVDNLINDTDAEEEDTSTMFMHPDAQAKVNKIQEFLNNTFNTIKDKNINNDASDFTADDNHDLVETDDDHYDGYNNKDLDMLKNIDKNKNKIETKKYSNITAPLDKYNGMAIADLLKPNSLMIAGVDIDDILVVIYTINGESIISIGVDDGKFIKLVGDPVNTSVSKSFVDKTYKIGDNLVLLIKSMFMK